MVTLKEILNRIEQTAPLSLAASWDNSGIQIAAHRQEIRRLAVFLDPLPLPVSKAIQWNADFLLCHHPLAIAPRLPSRIDSLHAVLKTVLCSDVWLYAAHTSLDANTTGPVSWMARELSLGDVRPLEPSPALEDKGIGLVGTLRDSAEWGYFATSLKRILGTSQWRIAGPLPDRVRRVAYCPGSGVSLFKEAILADADVFITGDLKFHQAQECAEQGLCLVDVGHFILEERMMQNWAGELQEELPGVEVRFIPDSDPVRAYTV